MCSEERKDDTKGERGKKKAKKVWTIVGIAAGSIALLTGSFFGGYFTYASKIDGGVKSLLWAKETIRREYKYDVSDEEFYEAALNGLNDILDPYSEYLSKNAYAQTLDEATGKWSGVGLQFSTMKETGESQILVVRVSGNSPAYRAGVKVGSTIVAYGLNEDDLTEANGDYNAFNVFLQAQKTGEPFVLRMQDGATGEETNYVLQKESFVESYVFYRSNTTSYAFVGENALEKVDGGNPLSELGTDAAYIRLTQFNGRAAEEFDEAMSVFKAEKKKHLVLDLRFNGGGYMDILRSIAKYFCKEGTGANPTVASAKYKSGTVTNFAAKDNLYYDYFTDESRICVLADDGTASASECLIGCMVDYGTIGYGDIYLSERVEKVVENGATKYVRRAKTYGKGIMQSYFSRNVLKTSETLKLTTAEVLWPVSGKCIHGVGVTSADGAKTIAENHVEDGEIKAAISDFLQKD